MSLTSSHLKLLTGVASIVAVGSAVLLRRLIANAALPGSAAVAADGEETSSLTRNERRGLRLVIESVHINIAIRPHRRSVQFNFLIAVGSPRSSTRTRLDLSVRLGRDHRKGIAVLLILLVLRSWMTPVLLLLREEIEVASIAYLRTLGFPQIACRIA